MPSIPVNASGGVEITGLVSGALYGLSTTGGPFHPHGIGGGTDDQYIVNVSNNGSTWSVPLGRPADPGGGEPDGVKPAWVDSRREIGTYYFELLFYATGGSVWIRVNDSFYGDNTGSLDYTLVRYDSYCAYGTQKNPAAAGIVFVTDALVDLAVELTGASALIGIAFGAIIGIPLVVGDICSTMRPPLPIWTWDDFTPTAPYLSDSGIAKALQTVKIAVWSLYCQCVPEPPGGTPPVEPPQPVFPPTGPSGPGGPTFPPGPGGGGNPPPIVCDSTSICTILNDLTRTLYGHTLTLARLSANVELIQRQKVPFGYIPGAVHVDLVADGHFDVFGLIGLAVDLTTIPAGHPALGGDPTTYHQLGKISLGTADGWERSFMPTHNPYLIFPIEAAITRVGYALASGVVASITELIRES